MMMHVYCYYYLKRATGKVHANCFILKKKKKNSCKLTFLVNSEFLRRNITGRKTYT